MKLGRIRIGVLTILSMLVLSRAPQAHHIMGIPHYAYSEDYPQAPVITYKVAAGPYILQLTGYPGRPIPHELTQMNAYIYNKANKADVFPGPLQAMVYQESMGKREVVFGPVPARFEEKMHKFSPIYGDAGKYIVRMEMQIEGQPYQVDMPILVGDPASPLMQLLTWVASIFGLLIVLRAIKIKRARQLEVAG